MSALRRVAALVVFMLLVVVACRDVGPEVQTATDMRDFGHASDQLLTAVCERQYLRAAELPEAQAGAEVFRIDSLGCREAAVAHDALRAAHGYLVAVLRNIDAGKCAGTPLSRPPDCDLMTAIADVVDASTELAVVLGAARAELQRIARDDPLTEPAP